MRPRVLRRRLTLALFGAILAGSLLGTGLARADTMDDIYILTLDQEGITYTTPEQAIRLGHLACDSFDAGAGLMATAGAVLDASELMIPDAAFLTGVAVGAYCPEYADEIKVAVA